MSAGWVAAGVRARALAHRRLGSAGARALAASPSLDRALATLADSPYGHDVRRGQSLAQAQHAVAATLLWHARVLAGWLPRGDARILRALAGGFEVANVDERLRELSGSPPEPAFRLGGLSTSWPALSAATSAPQLRTQLARSAWGDPGTDTVDGIRLGMRLSWAARVSASAPAARSWAVGATALLIARAHLLDQTPIAPASTLVATRLIGARWQQAHTLAGFVDALPSNARWVLAAADDAGDLWRAEATWWAGLTGDGFRLLRRPVTTPDPVLGAAALLAADAWLVRAALEVAARASTSSPALEAFDAVA